MSRIPYEITQFHMHGSRCNPKHELMPLLYIDLELDTPGLLSNCTGLGQWLACLPLEVKVPDLRPGGGISKL